MTFGSKRPRDRAVTSMGSSLRSAQVDLTLSGPDGAHAPFLSKSVPADLADPSAEGLAWVVAWYPKGRSSVVGGVLRPVRNPWHGSGATIAEGWSAPL